MADFWSEEIWRGVGILAIALLIGALFDRIPLCLFLATAGYLIWHLRNIDRLARWLLSPGQFQPPRGRGVWSDIFDELYRQQKRNREKNRKLKSYLLRYQESTAAMPDATVVLDQLGQIEWLNAPAQELLGLDPHKDLGQYITNLVRNPAFKDYYDKGAYDQPLEMPAPVDSQRIITLRVVPYGRNQRLVIAREITRIRRLEQMRREFIANISHELRTPLTVLKGYLETINDTDAPELERLRPTLQQMQQQTERMTNIVEDLLTLSRLEQENTVNHSEPVPVPTLLAAIHDDAVTLSGNKHHVFELDIDERLWLDGVTKELHSAFSNLVINAVRYTPAGGHIRIRWFRDAEGAHLQVSDTGIGILPQHIPRLTERFYRVDVGRSRDIGGTGLGLAIVNHILIRHQAKLHIESQVDVGSTFSCDFPPERIIVKTSLQEVGQRQQMS